MSEVTQIPKSAKFILEFADGSSREYEFTNLLSEMKVSSEYGRWSYGSFRRGPFDFFEGAGVAPSPDGPDIHFTVEFFTSTDGVFLTERRTEAPAKPNGEHHWVDFDHPIADGFPSVRHSADCDVAHCPIVEKMLRHRPGGEGWTVTGRYRAWMDHGELYCERA